MLFEQLAAAKVRMDVSMRSTRLIGEAIKLDHLISPGKWDPSELERAIMTMVEVGRAHIDTGQAMLDQARVLQKINEMAFASLAQTVVGIHDR